MGERNNRHRDGRWRGMGCGTPNDFYSPQTSSARWICEDHLAAIPSSLKSVWDALYNEVVALHARWINFDESVNRSPERTRKLYETASTFFYILQTTLIDDIQLTLGRLGDPCALRHVYLGCQAVDHSRYGRMTSSRLLPPLIP